MQKGKIEKRKGWVWKMRKSFDKEFMARVALEAIKEEKTIAEISSQYEVHRTQITKWRKRAMEGIVGIFQGREGKEVGDKERGGGLGSDLENRICWSQVDWIA